ncbi:DUF1223 domain-containing protein [Vibrio sp. WXL103]|uniref:DUF1223 domain-containing protein n=1 Tax=Vibrio sp. WXL103 TaxID=3450710 RepID=UPI003EC55CC6
MMQSMSLMSSLGVLLLATTANAAQQTWTHQGKPAQLVELFTSEGCSSCPPADQFLSQFQSQPRLWHEVIPMAFHVDYWDRLGWKDEYANPAYSQRQRLYYSYGALSSVYTPGFVVDGQEWRGFFYRQNLPERVVEDAGALTLVRQEDGFSVRFEQPGRYTAHLVLLAMDESTKVKAGENRGRYLEHDFVVLEKLQTTGEQQWHFDNTSVDARADAVAVWLTQGVDGQPVQTVAGLL